MKNIPDKVYMQIGEGNEDENDFNEISGVTWSFDKIFDSDIEYCLKLTTEQVDKRLIESFDQLTKLYGNE